MNRFVGAREYEVASMSPRFAHQLLPISARRQMLGA
jgi:hypothetical protein